MKQSINYFIINSQSRPSVYLSTIQAVSQPVNQLNSQSISQSTIQSVWAIGTKKWFHDVIAIFVIFLQNASTILTIT